MRADPLPSLYGVIHLPHPKKLSNDMIRVMGIPLIFFSSFQNCSRLLHSSLQTRVWPLPFSLTVKAEDLPNILRFTRTNYITNIFFCTYYKIKNKMKNAVKSGEDLPTGQLGPAAITIPEVFGDFPNHLTKIKRQKHLALEASKL